MGGKRVLAVVSAVAIGALAAVPAASAKDGDVIVRSTCSAGSEVKLKLSEEDGGIEVELEVDQSRSGVRWSVTLVADGSRVFSGARVTRGPSGSFEVRRVIANGAGPDVVRARATRASGEVCTVRATFPG